jgi:hypothetical protein
MGGATEIVQRWSAALHELIPDFFASSPALREVLGECCVMLHGSTTSGIEDAFSDLDLWVIVPQAKLAQAESIAGTRFFSFTFLGKKGHFNLESVDEMNQRVQNCDLEVINEIRLASIIRESDGMGQHLFSAANQPMSEPVRRAWFCYHYVEMRGFHRNGDNPIERGDAVAVLQALVPTLNHAMRAAMVLDGVPYPYIKWLGNSVAQTPTGSQVIPIVNEILDLLAQGALRIGGPEPDHPLGKRLREIRVTLIDAARANGIDEPWLERWWVHMTQAAEGIATTKWAAAI